MPHPLLISLQSLPPGKVTTYKLLADKFLIHPRAVAKILAKNTQPDIYPCYKVVHHDGKIGGYNLGVEEKCKRLEKDGISITYHQDLSKSKVSKIHII